MRLFLNPALFLPLVWLSTILGSNLSGKNFYPYSNFFYLYIASAVAVFGFSCLFAQFLVQRFSLGRFFQGLCLGLSLKISSSLVVGTYLFFMTVSLVFQCLDRWIYAGSSWWLPEGLTLYRLKITEFQASSNFPFISLFNYFFFSAIPLLILYKKRISLGNQRLIILLLIIFIYLSTSRSSLFVICLIGTFFLLHYKHDFKNLIIAGMVLYLAFGLIGTIVGKNPNSADAVTFWSYAFAPSHALDQIISGFRADEEGAFYTLRPIYGILAKFHLISSSQKLLFLLPYYKTPYYTNVYTMFGPYILDYGIAISFLWIGFFGTISGIIYGLTIRYLNNPYFVFLSSLNLSIITLGVFHDYYTSAGFVWASIFLGAIVFTSGLHRSKSTGNSKAIVG